MPFNEGTLLCVFWTKNQDRHTADMDCLLYGVDAVMLYRLISINHRRNRTKKPVLKPYFFSLNDDGFNQERKIDALAVLPLLVQP